MRPEATVELGPLCIALTDHVEAAADTPADEIYGRVERFVCQADRLGFDYFWFSEHHAHAHFGHLPSPLLFALHLAGRTERIRLGAAIVCLNLHHPLDIAEQVAVADHLSRGRMSVGFGSGSTPEEFGYFGLQVTDSAERHARFAEALRILLDAWSGEVTSDGPNFVVPLHRPLPVATSDLQARSWLAVNSVGSARIAGELGFNMMFSHLRTPEQYNDYLRVYWEAGGSGMSAANRPVFVGADDSSAWVEAEPALRTLWRRFQREGKVPADCPEPRRPQDLCAHPINFIVGGPETVAREIRKLRRLVSFNVINLEPHWADLSEEQVSETIRRLACEVRPLL